MDLEPDLLGAFECAICTVAGGDAQLAEGLRRIAWEAYLLAGLPLGPDEEGLAAWWEEQRSARSR